MSAPLLVVIVILVVVGLLVGAQLTEKARIRRALRKLSPVRIGQAPERQLVRLEGRVLDGEALTAPLSGRRCVFYLATVEEWVSSGKSGRWKQRIQEQRGVGFTIEDGSGKAIVDSSGSRVDVQLDVTTRSGTFDDAAPVEESFLQRHGMTSKGWFFNKKLRYREGVIEIGEKVAVAGRVVREPDPEAGAGGGYREGPATRLRVGGTPDAPLLLSDSLHVVTRD